MKRILSFLLILSMLASQLAGCGREKKAPAATTGVMETAVEITEVPETEAPTTAPTLSPEEVLYQSLPDRLKQAVDVGILELSQLEDLTRTVTVGEASAMLQRAYASYYGTESRLMADVLALDCVNEPAYLGWIGRLPFALYTEALEPENYESYDQWMELVTGYTISGRAPELIPTADLLFYRYGEDVIASGPYDWFDIGWSSGMKTYFYENMEPGNTLLESCLGQGGLLAYTMLMYDKTTGDKVLDCNGYNTLPATQIMTVETMAEMALRTYHAFYKTPNPVPYESCTVVNDTILTAELVNRETTLPDASCSNLPDSWHGVTLSDWSIYESWGLAVDYDLGFDAEIYEYEIQAVKDAGFNYIGLQIDLSWLQGNDYVTRQNSVDGNLDLNRLEKLDQVLAWCMERDIHLDIRATGFGGFVPETKNRGTAEDFAALWSVLAQRYAHIPNTYLSFTVIDSLLRNFNGDMGFHLEAANGWNGGKGGQKKAVDFIRPAVEAIRAASADRCIIADLSGCLAVGTDILELGVALSADLTAGNGFFLIRISDYLNPSYYLDMHWPYGETGTAEAMLSEKLSWEDDTTVLNVVTMARENNLGFMISGWGEIPLGWSPTGGHPAYRYPDETYHAFIADTVQTMENLGCGWCYEEWYSPNGIVYSTPLIKNVSYQQLEDYPLYYDTAMLGWFREINGVS